MPDDDATENSGVDPGVDRDVATKPGFEVGLELGDLIVGQRMGRGDLGSGLTAVPGGELADRLDHGLELGQAAIVGQHAEELGRDLIDAQRRNQRADRFAGVGAPDQRAGHQAAEIGRFGHRRLERIEAARHRVDLFFVTGEAEQRGGVTPR